MDNEGCQTATFCFVGFAVRRVGILEMAERIRFFFFFKFWGKKKKLFISDLVCQVSTRSEFLWSNYKTLKIGVYNGNTDTTVTMVLQLHH